MTIADFIHKKKALAVFTGIIAVALVIYLVFALSSASTRTVPSAFTDARMTASGHAEDIVGMLSQTTSRIHEAKQLIEQRRNAQALTIVSQETEKNAEVREKAIQLALELEKMAREIPNIRSSSAAQVALVATSKETALIGKLLAYTNELNDLLNELHIVVLSSRPNYASVNESIATINSAATEINALNDEYKKEMEVFDRIVKGEQVDVSAPLPSVFPTVEIETTPLGN
jgi:ribonucleotide monophosphatase NagD (HAD superfamily)